MFDPLADTGNYVPIAEYSDSFFATNEVSFRFNLAGATHTGLVRSRNEDHFAIFEQQRTTKLLQSNLPQDSMKLPDDRSYSMVVVDGMGGMNAGHVASRLALQTMVELSGQATSWVMKLIDLDA